MRKKALFVFARVAAMFLLLTAGSSCSGSSTGSSYTSISSSSPTAASATELAPSPASLSPIKLTGSGQSTPKFAVTSGLAIIVATYDGSDNFSIELEDSNGQVKDTPVNVTGRYSGSVGEGLDAGTYILKIDASGQWSVTITQPRSQAGAGLPQTYAGTGQQIVGPFSAGRGAVLQAKDTTGSAGGNFSVTVLDRFGAEVARYSGSPLSENMFDMGPNGPYYLNVDSHGTWTITVSRP